MNWQGALQQKCVKQELRVSMLSLSLARQLLLDALADAGFVCDTATMLGRTIKGTPCKLQFFNQQMHILFSHFYPPYICFDHILVIIRGIPILLLLLLFTAIGFSPGGSSFHPMAVVFTRWQ
jgi:hypothetical protein